MTDEAALNTSKVPFKFHHHSGHHWCLSPVCIALVNILWLLTPREMLNSFKAGTRFFVTATAASVFPAHTRSKELIDLLCSLVYLWDLSQVT